MALLTTKRRIKIKGEMIELEVNQLDEKDADSFTESSAEAAATCAIQKVNEAQVTRCYAGMTRLGSEIPTMVIKNPGEKLDTLKKAKRCAKSIGSDILYLVYSDHDVELEPPLYICKL